MFFTINESKCKRDGICVAECPMKIIEMQDDNSLPAPTADAEGKCILCGHCVAVCPHGAFSHNQMPIEGFPEISEEWTLSAGQAEQFLRSRRSIRVYKEKEVDRSLLTRLIEIARYAPTGTNSQQVHWLVVNSRSEVVKLTDMAIDSIRGMIKADHVMAKKYNLAEFVSAWEQGVDFILRGAPALVMTHAPKAYGLAQVDCTLALAYFDVAAPTLDLGTCWAGLFMAALSQYQPLIDALALPEDHGMFGAMMVGHPKFTYQHLVPRKAPVITWK
jgi:nitroreductase/NAD-dependent dihydropyrimidine dehydrogenase PreA subunit